MTDVLPTFACVRSMSSRNTAGHVLPAWLRFFDTAEDGDGQVVPGGRKIKTCFVANLGSFVCYS